MRDSEKIEHAENVRRRVVVRGAGFYAHNSFTIVMVVAALALILIKPDRAADYIRAVQIATSVYIFFFSIRILRVNWMASKLIRGADARLLPAHIMGVAASYMCYVGACTAGIVQNLHHPAQFELLIPATFGGLLGVVALGIVWRFQVVKIENYNKEHASA